MRRRVSEYLPGRGRSIGPLPEIANAYSTIVDAELAERDSDLAARGSAIERGDDAAAACELAQPDLAGVFALDAAPLPTEGILIDRDDLRRSDGAAHLVRHIPQIVPRHERCGQDRPEREMRAALVDRELTIPDLEHVGVVPVIRSREAMEVRLPTEDRHHARPIRPHVPGRTPKTPDRPSPLPPPPPTPLAAIASAVWMSGRASTFALNRFQLLQPIGGVGASPSESRPRPIRAPPRRDRPRRSA